MRLLFLCIVVSLAGCFQSHRESDARDAGIDARDAGFDVGEDVAPPEQSLCCDPLGAIVEGDCGELRMVHARPDGRCPSLPEALVICDNGGEVSYAIELYGGCPTIEFYESLEAPSALGIDVVESCDSSEPMRVEIEDPPAVLLEARSVLGRQIQTPDTGACTKVPIDLEYLQPGRSRPSEVTNPICIGGENEFGTQVARFGPVNCMDVGFCMISNRALQLGLRGQAVCGEDSIVECALPQDFVIDDIWPGCSER